VPLHAPPLIGAAPRRAPADPAPRGASSGRVAQIADYLRVRSASTRPAPAAAAVRTPRAAPLPASVKAHAAELESLLRDHIDVQLDQMRAHAPEFHAPIDSVRRSIALLMRLRGC